MRKITLNEPAGKPEDVMAVPCSGTQQDERPAFPVDALPDAAKAITLEISRTRLLPYDLPGAMALAVTAAALGKGLELDCPPHRTRPNLFVLASARSGTGKSDCFRDIAAPLYFAEEQANEAHEQTRHQKSAEAKLLEKEMSKISGEASPENIARYAELSNRLDAANKAMQPRRMVIEDATEAAMKHALAGNREQIALLSPEGGQVVSNLLGRYGDAKGQTADTVVLKSFSGDPDAQHRVGSGESRLKAPCMSIALILTPDKCRELFRNPRFVEGGLMPRFLIATSEARPQRDDGTERRPAAATLDRWKKTILDLVVTYRNADAPAVIRCEPEAIELFRDHWNREFVDSFDELEDDAAFHARHLEQAKRIAVNLHALKHGKAACVEHLTAGTAQDALDLVAWFAANQERSLADSRADQSRTLIERIQDVTLRSGIQTDQGRAVPLRTLKRSGITEATARKLVTDQPDDFQFLTRQTGGRASRCLVVKGQ